MRVLAQITKKHPGTMRLAAGVGTVRVCTHDYPISSTTLKPPETITPSTGPGPTGWRLYWAVQSRIDGTDWASLRKQHIDAWRRLRSLAEPFATGLSSHAPGTQS
jgi:hypothetical protein